MDAHRYIEILDIAGYSDYPMARNVFYDQYDGIILVHDLTQPSTYHALPLWLEELNTSIDIEMSPKRPLSTLPILIVGTRLDQCVSIPSCPLSIQYQALVIHMVIQ
jgi:GTPase SAR1 family protein